MDSSGIIAIFILFFVALLLLIIILAVKRAREVSWLKQHGTRIIASVSEIKARQEAYQVPHQVPKQQYNSMHKRWETTMQTQYQTQWRTCYYVVAKYVHPQTNQVYIFESDRLLSKPKNYTRGSGVSVLFDPNDSRRYYMEIF